MGNFFTNAIGKLFGNKYEKDIKKLNPIVEQINTEYEKLKSISNDELRNKTVVFRQEISEALKPVDDKIADIKQQAEKTTDFDQKESLYNEVDKLKEDRDKQLETILEKILPRAFAVVKETARRFTENSEIVVAATELDKQLAVDGDFVEIKGNSAVYKNEWTAAGSHIKWQMVHYNVQLIGGIVLHQGKIAEMQTGEGKTLVSTLPAYLNALPGLGVHIVTVNNYLALRDSEWNAPIYNFLGLTVNCIDKYTPNSPERRAAYRADITYGTNNEFGFDYLRDNMVRNSSELVQHKLHYAMVDEVDSVLVDDARTPLIISGPVDKGDEKQFYELKPRISKLFDAQKKIANKCLNDAKRLIADGKDGYKPGEGGFALLQAHRALPKNKPLIKYLSETGVKQILQKTENYYLQDQAKEMPIVDEDLLFVIEEKQNSVDLTDKGIDLITGAGEDKNFFIVPVVGAEIAEIEKLNLSEEEKVQRKDELMLDFAIKTERLHSIQQLLKAYTLFEIDVEYVVMDGKVKIVDENTGRIMEGRRFSDGLHQALEAKENVKVQEASQTMATVTLQNFFRMYHKLAGMTGTAETEASEFWDIYKLDVVVIPTNKPIARNDMDDKVYKTVKEKYYAIADEIQSLTQQGRPVLVGTTNVEVSELLSRLLQRKGIKHNVLNAKQHQREAEIVAQAGKAGAVTIATNMAGRGTDIKLSDEVKQAGGLAIIGSERHDSRRVDRQLRGRAGRQGDTGSSQFYASLEDKLMRLFGSERIAKVMDRFGYEEGEVIQHKMISNSIERAQKKVEENNFGMRKNTLEYDDVMNTQREVIYKKRKHALFGERLGVDIMNSFYDLCEELVATNRDGGFIDYENFKTDLIRFFALNSSITEDQFANEKHEAIVSTLFNEVNEAYTRKMNGIASRVYPVFKRINEERGETVKNIVVPFTDGKIGFNAVVPLADGLKDEGKSTAKAIEKSISLHFIDEAWKDHLRQMDDLKREVRNAQFEQKDPLLIYKLEGYELFKSLIGEINRKIASFLFKANLPQQNPNDVKTNQQQKQTNMSRMTAGRDNSMQQPTGGNGQQQQQEQPKKMAPVKVGPKVGRNEPCPCGSGKKFKQCHGKN